MSNAIRWVKSDGNVQTDGASLVAGTYYGEIPVDMAAGFAVDVVCDATAVATITIEGTVRGSSLATHTAVGTGWTALPSLGSVAPAASATSFLFEVSGANCPRYRLKNVVGTGGVITAQYQVKG